MLGVVTMAGAGPLRAADAPATSPEAAALLAKHVAYVGWKYGDGTVKSLKLERTYTIKGGSITQYAHETREVLVYRRDYEFPEHPLNNNSTGFTGNIFWRTNENGFTTPFFGDEAKELLSSDALFIEGTPVLPASMHGTGTVDGKTVPVVRVTMQSASPIDVYVDPDTGAYLRAVVDPGGAKETVYDIKSYLDIAPGKKIIGSWTIDGGGTYAYTKAQLNPLVSDGDLHPPASSATWTFANDQPFPIKVTDARIYVDAKVNGVPGRFILDTGDYGITLFDEFADRAHMKDVTHSAIYGIGGGAKTRIRLADTIDVGGNTLANVIVNTINTEFNDDRYNEKPDGLIGFDLLGGAIVTVSTANQTMRIENPAATNVDKSVGINVIADLSDGRPVVPMQINKKVPIDALLDTGNTAFVLLASDLRGRGINMLVDNSQLSSHIAIGGVGGHEAVECGRVNDIALGPIDYQNPAACLSHSFTGREALIGFDFFKHFDYIFDYPESLIIITPHKDE